MQSSTNDVKNNQESKMVGAATDNAPISPTTALADELKTVTLAPREETDNKESKSVPRDDNIKEPDEVIEIKTPGATAPPKRKRLSFTVSDESEDESDKDDSSTKTRKTKRVKTEPPPKKAAADDPNTIALAAKDAAKYGIPESDAIAMFTDYQKQRQLNERKAEANDLSNAPAIEVEFDVSDSLKMSFAMADPRTMNALHNDVQAMQSKINQPWRPGPKREPREYAESLMMYHIGRRDKWMNDLKQYIVSQCRAIREEAIEAMFWQWRLKVIDKRKEREKAATEALKSDTDLNTFLSDIIQK
jgi:hypothetical protein